MRLAICAAVILMSALTASAQSTCGKLAAGARCPGGRCCSNFGYYGNSTLHCGSKWCKIDCWTDYAERSDSSCGPALGNPPCGENRCCSLTGFCGDTADFCSDGRCQYRCWNTTSSPSAAVPNRPNATASSFDIDVIITRRN